METRHLTYVDYSKEDDGMAPIADECSPKSSPEHIHRNTYGEKHAGGYLLVC